MKPLRLILPLAVISAIASVALADSPKPLALSPAPHPGKEALHATFNKISKNGEAPLVFLGDSITEGWSGKGKAVWEQYWAPLEAANFGIGGDRTEHILWRLANGNYDGLTVKASSSWTSTCPSSSLAAFSPKRSCPTFFTRTKPVTRSGPKRSSRG